MEQQRSCDCLLRSYEAQLHLVKHVHHEAKFEALGGFTNTHAKSVTVTLVQCRKLIGIQQGTGRRASISSTYEVRLAPIQTLLAIDLCEFTSPKTI